MDRIGLRLKLRKAQAEAGDIVLLFADESEALARPYLARAWARRGATCVCGAGASQEGCDDGLARLRKAQARRHRLATKRSADFIEHLRLLDHLYGRRPGAPFKPVILVLDNGPIHVSKAAHAALANAPIGSPSSGCPNTPRNSTTSRSFGAI